MFIWCGKIQRQATNETINGNSSTASFDMLSWQGCWTGCTDCADACIAPTPRILHCTDMKFKVLGKRQRAEPTTVKDTILEYWDFAYGEGWDLGEGDEKRRYTDNQHVVVTRANNLMNVHATADEEEQQEISDLVVAIGDNEFGNFISAGYVTRAPDNNDHLYLILGRRYLDSGDARAKWTGKELYQKIASTDRGMLDIDWSRQNIAHDSKHPFFKLRIAPWRTLDMHSQKRTNRGGRRKRKLHEHITEKDSPISHEPLPKLYFPERITPKISFTTDSLSGLTQWVEQCPGCGRELEDPDLFCAFIINEYNGTEKKNGEMIGAAVYCTESCVIKNGVSAWVKASQDWKNSHQEDIHAFIEGKGHFWDVVSQNESSRVEMENAGWTLSGPGRAILNAK